MIINPTEPGGLFLSKYHECCQCAWHPTALAWLGLNSDPLKWIGALMVVLVQQHIGSDTQEQFMLFQLNVLAAQFVFVKPAFYCKVIYVAIT